MNSANVTVQYIDQPNGAVRAVVYANGRQVHDSIYSDKWQAEKAIELFLNPNRPNRGF